MGIFTRTEEELKTEKEYRTIKNLKDKISYSNEINQNTANTLTRYLNEIINRQRTNDFFEIDFLCAVINELNVDTYEDGSTVKEHLSKIIACVNELLPFGERTTNYNEIKENIIKYFVAPEGYIDRGIYDFDIYNEFDSIKNYMTLMKTLANNEIATENFQKVKKYIHKAKKWNLTEEEFKNNIVSVINRLDDNVLDIDKYLAEEYEDDRKKYGVYSLGEDSLAESARLINLVDNKIEQIQSETERLDDKKREIQIEGINNIQKVHHAGEEEQKKLRNEKKEIVAESINNINKVASEVELNLNIEAKKAFSEALEEYTSQINQLKKEAKYFTSESEKKVLDAQNQANKIFDAIAKLSNDPELKTVQDQIDQGNKIRETIQELIKTNEELMKSPGYQNLANDSLSVEGEKIVKGISKTVAPANPGVYIPDSIKQVDQKPLKEIFQFTAAKDIKIARRDLHKVLDNIEKMMDVKRSQGEYYHEKTLEIIKCLLVGDWPYVFGPSGAGKNYMAKQISELLDLKLIEGGSLEDTTDIYGYIDPQNRFRVTPTFEACVEGGLLLCDEFDSGNPQTLISLNGLYTTLRDAIRDPSSKQFITFAKEIHVPISPNMRMLSFANTDGSGGDELYDRNKIDEAVMERQKIIYAQPDSKVEDNILNSYPEWKAFSRNFRNACITYAKSKGDKSGNAPGNISTRDNSDLKTSIDYDIKTLSEILDQIFIQGKEAEYLDFIEEKLREEYDIAYEPENHKDYTGSLVSVTGDQIATQCVKQIRLGGIRRTNAK